MIRNILFFILGALAVSALIERPTYANDVNLSNIHFAISGKEAAILKPGEATIYYYNKLDGKFLRAHKVNALGKSMSSAR